DIGRLLDAASINLYTRHRTAGDCQVRSPRSTVPFVGPGRPVELPRRWIAGTSPIRSSRARRPRRVVHHQELLNTAETNLARRILERGPICQEFPVTCAASAPCYP